MAESMVVTASTINAKCCHVNSQFRRGFVLSVVDTPLGSMQQRAKRAMTVIDPVDYRLMRQLRSASAGPNMSAQCKHNYVGLDSNLDDPTRGRDQLNITQAQTEAVIEPDGMLDDLGREAEATVRIRRNRHAAQAATIWQPPPN